MTLSRKFLIVVAVVLGLCIGASFVAGRLVRSPEQVAADAAPPPPSVLTSPVLDGYVTQAIVARGSVTQGRTKTISGAAPEGAESVVTKRPVRVGDKVVPGMVVAEVSYRPIIALAGRIPMIRDLPVGSEGPEVAQLQAAVKALGWTIYDDTGKFGPSTASALKRLYESVGYVAPTLPNIPEATESSDTGDDQVRSSSGQHKTRGRAESSGKGDSVEKIVARKSELVMISGLPGRVAALSGQVGEAAGEGLLTVSTEAPTIRALIPPAQRSLVRVGDQVTLSSASPAYSAKARVGHVGSPTQDERSKAYLVPVKLITKKAPPAGILDQGIQVRFQVGRNATKGMIVPVSAVRTMADGLTAVTRVRAGSTESVSIRVLETGSGRARIEPERSGMLVVGDLVRVGALG